MVYSKGTIGAAIRAKERVAEGGGFAGLSAEEALKIGNQAKHYGQPTVEHERTMRRDLYESDPSKFPDGAYWMLNQSAREQREARMRQIAAEQDKPEKPYRGLTADEALAIGMAARHFHHDASKNMESDPSSYAEGAYYLNSVADQARSLQMDKVKQLAEKEYPAIPAYKGLTEDEAKRIGEEAHRLHDECPAQALEIQFEDPATIEKKRKKRRAMQARMRARHECRAAKHSGHGLPMTRNHHAFEFEVA
jgi:hypothetical protein